MTAEYFGAPASTAAGSTLRPCQSRQFPSLLKNSKLECKFFRLRPQRSATDFGFAQGLSIERHAHRDDLRQKGAATKPRLLFFGLIIWSFAPVAMAQNAIGPDAASVATTQSPAPQLLGDARWPDSRVFTLLPDTEGESSSRFPSGAATLTGTAVSTSSTVAAANPVDTPCDRPAELFDASEYDGPLKRIAAWFARNPELTTVPARRKNGQRICGLDAHQKFDMFVETSIDPVIFMGAAASAGFSQWQNDDSKWGQGAAAYGQRYAAALIDAESSNFFGQFFYPVIFRQDPRYYRKGNGTAAERFGYALTHTFVTRSDSGKRMPNYSLWATMASTVALANIYHPGNHQGFPPAATRVGISIAGGMGYDLLREFWPEIVRKLRLPFRERPIVPVTAAAQH